MTNEEKVNKFITLLMGKCWHEIDNYGKCKKCHRGTIDGASVYDDYFMKYDVNNFDAFSPDGIFEWKEFMEKKLPEVWERYLECYENIWITKGLQNQLNARNLAQWMTDKENMELWAYVECLRCEGHPNARQAFDEDTNECEKIEYYHCNGTGKIINPPFEKVVEWIEKEAKCPK